MFFKVMPSSLTIHFVTVIIQCIGKTDARSNFGGNVSGIYSIRNEKYRGYSLCYILRERMILLRYLAQCAINICFVMPNTSLLLLCYPRKTRHNARE
jgi:hypothetical protein